MFAVLILILVSSSTTYSQDWYQQRLVQGQFEKALIYYDEGNFKTANKILRKILNKQTGEYAIAAHLLQMKTTFALGEINESKTIGKTLLVKFGQHQFIPETYMVLGDIYVSEGDFNTAFRMYLRAREYKVDELFLQKLDDRINKLIQLNLSLSVLKELAIVHPGENETIIQLAEAFALLSAGEGDDVAYLLKQIKPEKVLKHYINLYEKLTLVSNQSIPKSYTFGILVPITGKNSAEGKSFLKGLHHHNKLSKSNVRVTYQIEDTFSDPLVTIIAFDRLAENEQLLAIIVALDDEQSLLAINRNKNFKIPLLVPGGAEFNFTNMDEHVFQFYSDWQTQGRTAARWIAEYLQKENVALLVPDDDYGNTIANAFQKEMDALNKKVVIVERYSEDPVDLKKQFKRIRNTAFNLIPKKNRNEDILGLAFDSLNVLFEIDKEEYSPFNKDNRGDQIEDSSKVLLSTIQALYLPTYEEYVKYIGAQIPMYYLNTTLVGNHAWNQPDIFSQISIGPHLNGMTMLLQEKSGQLENSLLQNENEDVLLAYDICGLLTAVASKGTQNRREFVDQLELTQFEGLAHTFAFQPDNHCNTAVEIIQYKDRKFNPIGMFITDTVKYYHSFQP